ncbi:MAG: zinc ABC transporter substrate-binding protein [Mobilibacterium timonense]|uniref:metal ABC transporter substrate-binding protein n=1 Tax=Mobilibacterium timonense TaxID=1871012 RepID=UPI0023538D22|nr:metal ABC transporter substrate-binding protein [Mobilibacterium timonense]MBM6990377.1 zinc ABC transporter substrate-binding protein [Mobilibacterium timonense]
MKKKIVTILAAALAMAVVLSGCALPGGEADKKATNEKLSIVCTNFPSYDFARQIAGDKADVTMLLKPGAESHTYEPSPEDIKKIQDCDMFVYVGGDSDEWVEDVLDSMDKSKITVFRLMDQVKTVEEVTVEGMEPEDEEEPAESGEDEDEPEMDEHVWTSPKNAAAIVKNMARAMEKLDGKNKATYEKNAGAYVKKLEKLDEEFREVVKNGRRKEIIVADRFPFRYFCEEYGLKYYAAFPGCSTDTQPSAKTVAFLTDKVKEDKIPVVFHIELSNEEMSKSIAEATGAKSRLLNAVHNVSDEDFRNGATYVSLMEHNVEALKEALN